MVKAKLDSTTDGTGTWLEVNIVVQPNYFGVVTLYFTNYSASDALVDVAVATAGSTPMGADMIASSMHLNARGENTNTGEIKCHGVLNGERVFVLFTGNDVNCHAQAIAQPIATGVANA